MRERTQRRKETEPSTVLRSLFEAITVGEGKHAEPYIIAFHYKSDNIAGRGLGTLFGFFEVETHDEDAAYIVNFLASVAKKEYFANPRRSVEDGFETTLHKVNVALAEIVKEGNVSWLGHLHGIVGALSESTVHFSATGEGVLSLTREGVFRPISDGLAENLGEPHPLKTFTEVSSGHLMAGDVLLAFSPAIWTLFTPEDIKKNLARFDAAGFERFLKTALINELPIAGAVIIRVETEVLPQAKTIAPQTDPVGEKAKEALLTNVWSKQAFEKTKAARLTTLAVKQPIETEVKQDLTGHEKEEYTDQKTGHIYVQGDPEILSGDTEAWRDRLELFLQAGSRALAIQWGRWLRSIRRSRRSFDLFLGNVGIFGARLERSVSRRFRSALRRFQEARVKKQRASLQAEETSLTESLSQNISSASETSPSAWKALYTRLHAIKLSHSRLKPVTHYLLAIKDRFSRCISSEARVSVSNAMQEPTPATPTWPATLRASWVRFRYAFVTTFKMTSTRLRHTWDTRTQKERSVMLGMASLALTLVLGSFFYFNRSTLWESNALPTLPTSTPASETKAPTDLALSEPLAARLTDGQLLTASFQTELIAFVSINNVTLGITKNQIVNTKTQASVATPEPIRLATAMDDLNALFLLGESGVLHMYTLANAKFGESSLPLPQGVIPAAIGSYLTYLYVLDEKTKDIYRFPRAEGGFGAPIKWSKETIMAHDNKSGFIVHENIALIDKDNIIGVYERGKKTRATFGSTQEPVSARTLAFDKTTGDLLALDPARQRVIRWQADGTLVAQYFHPSFETATRILVGEKNILLTVHPDGTFAFQLP